MKRIYLSIALLAIGFVVPAPANAATFNVTTTNDTLDVSPGDGVCADVGAACSLRAAVGEANALAGDDIITLPMGEYTQTLVATANEDANLGGDWDITSTITINGVNELNTYVQAAATAQTASERVLDVRPGGNLTIRRLTARYGNFFGGTTPDTTRGAGIRNLGILTLDNAVVRSNRLTTGDPITAAGAGIYNAGTALTLNTSAVVGNVVSQNAQGNVSGAGIASVSVSTLTFTRAVIDSNTAQAIGGYAAGAGLYLENVFSATLTDSVFSNNIGNGTRGSSGQGVQVSSNAGAAIFNATNCVFRNNRNGGDRSTGVGIQFLTENASGTLTATLDGVKVDGNVGYLPGVGINANAKGGGIDLTIRNSSITNNFQWWLYDNYPSGATGMMVTNAGSTAPASSTVTVNITNTTISGNDTLAANAGGFALEQPSAGAVVANLDHVTIANNHGSPTGGLFHDATGTVNIKNSVVADNTAGSSNLPMDLWGAIVSGDYNHFENTTGATITGATKYNATGDAQLGPLVQYAGGTVHVPGIGSPLVDSIPNGTNGCGTTITTDQRGVLRPQGGGCDKGAVERAVSASISGRVTTFEGAGIRNATVILTGGGLSQPLTAQTGSMGYYSFPSLPGEQSYTLMASAKRYRFEIPGSILGVYLLFDATDANFVANDGFDMKPFEK